MESPVPVGVFFDVFPLSVMTTSTLTRRNELRPQSRFEQRRFRMNVIVRTEQPGHELQFGDEALVNVELLDPRCVMPTLAQDDLPQDTDVLRTLVRHNRMQVGDLGQFPCAGVYAVIAAPGTVRTGARVTVV
jgi:uncharacterized protein